VTATKVGCMCRFCNGDEGKGELGFLGVDVQGRLISLKG